MGVEESKSEQGEGMEKDEWGGGYIERTEGKNYIYIVDYTLTYYNY